MTTNLSPQERIDIAIELLNLDHEIHLQYTRLIDATHRDHTDASYKIIADALEELSNERLLYLCRTGHADA